MAGDPLRAAADRPIAIRTAPGIHAQGLVRCLGIRKISLFRSLLLLAMSLVPTVKHGGM